jgi:hypothetical protein
MPATPTPSKPSQLKVQPWKSVWPAPDEAVNNQYERKSRDGQSANGQYGFNLKGEGVAPAPEK